jgi:UDP-GlcNAc:undecaprenyl-phosphate GlcNAc-1-phosphate transferase
VLLLLFADEGRPGLALGAIVVFGLPISDMCLTLVRRRRAGRPLMKGDRSHFYDQLVDRGHSVRRVAVISYVLGGVFAVLGCAISVMSPATAAISFLGVAVGIGVAAKAARMVRIDQLPPHGVRSGESDVG